MTDPANRISTSVHFLAQMTQAVLTQPAARSGASLVNAPAAERFSAGDRVVVRALGDILSTLDSDGKLEGLPFMPEMAKWCGREMRVVRRAARACVEGYPDHRYIDGTVFLEGLRCDGAQHGGCQRACLLMWKEAWLRPAGEAAGGDAEVVPLNLLLRLPVQHNGRYVCQSTELGGASRDFREGRVATYLYDWRHGELSLRRFLGVLALAFVNRFSTALRGHRVRELRGNRMKTPTQSLQLQVGEWVRVRSRKEVQATLDATGRNRGLMFEAEMALHCGKRFRVVSRVENIISERTGQMLQLKDTVRLEGVFCHGIDARNCPRANPFYWREIWLEREAA